MKISLLKIAALAMVVFSMAACNDDDSADTSTLTLNLSGLEDLGSDYAYEGWIMVDGAPQTAGIFTVDGEGNPSQRSFDLDADALSAATAYILTIEPSPDPNPAPSDVHILAGDFAATGATLTVDHPAAVGTDFTAASGSFILATPTDDDDTNEASGVWFLDPSGPSAALSLPDLPAGWAYEGWAVIDGQPVTTGTFTGAAGADSAAPYSGSNPAPPFPGEDFLVNAPSGATFPVDLTDGMIVVSVEPVPDNSPAPFALKPLLRRIEGGEVHSSISLNNNAAATNPTGTASR
jgi:hypothetical protein